MTSLQNSPTLHRTLLHNTFPQKHATSRSPRRDTISFIVKAAQEPSASFTSQDRTGRRQVIAIGTTAPLFFLFNQPSYSFAAENKKGFLPVLDKKDGYSFLYPFGWQEIVIEGQDKVFKDVIEPLESVSVNLIPTVKQDIKEFGSPEQVAEVLVKKVLAPPNQKTKIIAAKEVSNHVDEYVNYDEHFLYAKWHFVSYCLVCRLHQQDIDGKAYYQFEFIAQAPNFTRHALSTVSIGNGKFYTLTTGANERRWEKVKDRLQTVVESFKIFNV